MKNMCGSKVRLRPIRLSDADVMCSWKNDEALYMYLGGGYNPISPDQYRKWVENMIDQTGSNRRFIVEDMDHNPIGMFGLYSINWIHRTCEVGGFLANVDARGRGAGSEAYHLLEEYAVKYLNLRKIILKVVDDNVSGKTFWMHKGFELAGRLRWERFINGKYCDVLILEKFIQLET